MTASTEQTSVSAKTDAGKSGEEPVSGMTGKGTKGQPFDAGNDEKGKAG